MYSYTMEFKIKSEVIHMTFTDEELEVIRSIRELLGDNSIDEYECLEVYEGIVSE